MAPSHDRGAELSAFAACLQGPSTVSDDDKYRSRGSVESGRPIIGMTPRKHRCSRRQPNYSRSYPARIRKPVLLMRRNDLVKVICNVRDGDGAVCRKHCNGTTCRQTCARDVSPVLLPDSDPGV